MLAYWRERLPDLGLPADYLAHGRDGDRDVRVDLKASLPDSILTGVRVLQHLGWRVGELVVSLLADCTGHRPRVLG